MTSWIRESFDQTLLEKMLHEASIRIKDNDHSIHDPKKLEKDEDLRFVESMLELSVLDLIDRDNQPKDLREDSADCFKLLRALPFPSSQTDAIKECLKISCFGIIGSCETETRAFLKRLPLSKFQGDPQNWKETVIYSTFEVWLHLIRNDNDDLEIAMNTIKELKGIQKKFEKKYFDGVADSKVAAAWELAAAYCLLKSARLQVNYIDSDIDNKAIVNENLKSQFSSAMKACERAELVELHSIIKLISCVSQKLCESRNLPTKRSPHDVSLYNFMVPLTLPSSAVFIPSGFKPFFPLSHEYHCSVRVLCAVFFEYNEIELPYKSDMNMESFLCTRFSENSFERTRSFNHLFTRYSGLRDNKGIFNLLQDENKEHVWFLKNKTPLLLFIKEIQNSLEEEGINSSVTIIIDKYNDFKPFLWQIGVTKSNAFQMTVSGVQNNIEIILPENVDRVTDLQVNEKIHLKQDIGKKELLVIGDISTKTQKIF